MKAISLFTIILIIFNIQFLHCKCCNESKDDKTKSTNTEQLPGFKNFTAENLAQDIGGFFNYTKGSSANVFTKNIYEKFNEFIEKYKEDNEAETTVTTGNETTWKEGVELFLILYKDEKYKIPPKGDITTIKKFLNDKEIVIKFGIEKDTGCVSYTIKSENMPK